MTETHARLLSAAYGNAGEALYNAADEIDVLIDRALTAEARVAQLERAIAADPLESERLRALIAEALDLLRAGVDPGEYAQSVWVSQIVATLMEADNGSPRPTPPEP